MTLTDESKILDVKIKANQAQYDLDREAAKILSFTELDKYEYSTGEDLGYQPGVVERAKFEYSILDEALNKELKKIVKSIRLLSTKMVWCMILWIFLINIVCLMFIKYH